MFTSVVNGPTLPLLGDESSGAMATVGSEQQPLVFQSLGDGVVFYQQSQQQHGSPQTPTVEEKTLCGDYQGSN